MDLLYKCNPHNDFAPGVYANSWYPGGLVPLHRFRVK